MKTAVICAMEEEIKPITGLIPNTLRRREAGIDLSEIDFDGHTVLIALSGVGKANAASCAQHLISTHGCDRIINVGMAGSCGAVPLGGVIVPDKAVYHDLPMEWVALQSPFVESFTPDESLAQAAVSMCSRLEIPCARGTLATGERFVDDSADRADIRNRTGCSCIDMEGAAIAHVAMKNGVPFVCIKVMSDSADNSALDSFNDSLTVKEYCLRSAAIVCGMLTEL